MKNNQVSSEHAWAAILIVIGAGIGAVIGYITGGIDMAGWGVIVGVLAMIAAVYIVLTFSGRDRNG